MPKVFRRGSQVSRSVLHELFVPWPFSTEDARTIIEHELGRPDIHKNNDGKLVYWHRDLPPLDAELMAEHTVEATSGRVGL